MTVCHLLLFFFASSQNGGSCLSSLDDVFRYMLRTMSTIASSTTLKEAEHAGNNLHLLSTIATPS